MKPVLFLLNITMEGPSELGAFLEERNIPYRVCDLSSGEIPEPFSPDDWSAVVPLGGPMNVDELDRYPWLAAETAMLRRCVEAGLPVLGICLGGQLLARALDAPVSASPTPEIGWMEVTLTPEGQQDTLFGGLGETLPVFQWHGDTFSLPDGAVRLAGSSICDNQAFRYGDCAYGVQFHLEVNEQDVAGWAKTYLPDIRSEASRAAATRLIDEPDSEKARRVHGVARTVFERFLSLSEEKK